MSASSEARFESANSRYGLAPNRLLLNHACTSGLNVDIRKYGKPMVAAKSNRIRGPGSSSPPGFHEMSGMIGSNSKAMTTSARCRPA